MMILMLAALAAADRPVVVSSLTTQKLAAQCQGADTDPAFTFCTGYILGEFDSLSLARQVCPTSALTSNIDVVAAARKYLHAHADKDTRAPSFVIRDALRAKFPCERK